MSEHVLSITSATVAADKEEGVVAAFKAATAELPHMVLNTFLVRGEDSQWKIITLWRSRAQLEAYRKSAGTPAAVKIFTDAGAEPDVMVYEVVHQAGTGL
jgi:heme-degrading monooxygenase HmoA